jgi:DNA-binding SARP family transcriptional activator
VKVSRLQVSLLGHLQIRVGSRTTLRLPTRKAAALLAYLAVRPGHRHPRPVLATLLWGDTGEEQARANLRHELYTLRRAFGARAAVLQMDARDVWIEPDAVETDLGRFEQAVRDGGEHLGTAIDLYRGEILEGFTLREDAFESWLRGERERVRGLVLDALEQRLAASAGAGRIDEALALGARSLAIDPLRESVHRALMRVHAAQGGRAAAARQYQACIDVLKRDLGTAPDPETTRLYQELMAGPPRMVQPRPSRRERPSRAPVSAGPPLIGRGAEMARIARLVDDAVAGQGGVLVLSGDAGIGKTRLVDELCARAAGARVVIGHCYQSHRDFVLGAWIEALRSSVVDDGAALAAVGVPYRAELASLIPELADAGAPTVSAGPLRLFEAVGRIVDFWTAAAPLVLVLEDLQWADDMTLRLFTFLARRVTAARLLLVGTIRDEEPESRQRFDPWLTELARSRVLQAIALAPLDRENADALVRHMATISRRRVDDDLLRAVWQTSEGNPLIVVEIMRAYGEGALDPRAPGHAVPEPVRALIRQRLDRLDAPTRRVLEIAAVIGRPFELRLLQAAADADTPVTLDHVEDLVRRRMLDDGAGGLDFSHDRVREVTRAAIVPTRRRVLHGQVAAALETLYADRLDDHAHALAVHHREVGAWERAARCFCHAGRVAVLRGANRPAVACYEDAFDALTRMPDTSERLMLGIDARIGCGQALLPLGEGDRLARYVAEAQAMCERLEDHRRLVDVLALATRNAILWKTPTDVLAAAERAYAVGQRSTEPEQVGDTGFCLAIGASFVGDEQRAVAIARGLIERGLDVTRSGAVFTAPREVQLRGVMAYCLAELGDLVEAREVGTAAVELGERLQRPFALIMASMALGLVSLRAHDARAAEAAFERATAQGRSAGFAMFAETAPAGLAIARAHLGRADEAIVDLERLVEETSGPTTRLWITYPSLWLAEAYLLAGRTADARRQANASLVLAKARGERTREGWALWLIGESMGRAGETASAQTCLEAALAIAHAGSLRPLEAHCHVGLARAHARAGERALARDAMAAAQRLVDALHLPAALVDVDQALLR